jgi:hypothetical protein
MAGPATHSLRFGAGGETRAASATRTFWSTTLYFGALSKGSNAVFQALEPGEITDIHFPFRLKKSLK